MAMIGPLPVSPAAPTPWSFNAWNRTVRDARGNYLFEINGEELDPDEDAALARELVDLVNRAASTKPYEDIIHAYAAGVMSAVFTEPPAVELPATVTSTSGMKTFAVNRIQGAVTLEVRRDGAASSASILEPASARTLAYALLAAAGTAPVEGPAEPDPGDPSTWRRYVDEVGDVWFEFAPGRVGCGLRDYLVRFVSDKLSRGHYPETLGEDLDDAREWFGLRPA